MLSSNELRQAIGGGLANIQDLGNGVLRGERIFKGRKFATAYIDVSDRVIERAKELSLFQEQLLGGDFFKGGDERWNSYLYFLAGPSSCASTEFLGAKAKIEGDRHFARKFVLTESELLKRLSAAAASAPSTAGAEDVTSKWDELLQQGSLGVVLEQRPRNRLVELIATGDAFVAVALPVVTKPASTIPDPLQSGFLKRLEIGSFRPALKMRTFTFGDVNLLFGLNGTGKTSLLEAVEAFYCGRTRRDPDADVSGMKGNVISSAGVTVSLDSPTNAALIRARNLAWYGRPDKLSSSISQGFTRFNFLDTDAAFRLSNETNPDLIKDDLSRLLVGAEASTLWAYIKKVLEDVEAGIRSAGNVVPSLSKQSELLSQEVNRLKGTPSQASTLRRNYEAGLRALGAKWPVDGEDGRINAGDRARLETLSRDFRQASVLTPAGDSTIAGLRRHVQDLEAAASSLLEVAAEYEKNTDALVALEAELKKVFRNTQQLEQWLERCKSGYPAAERRLTELRNEAESIRRIVGTLSIDDASSVIGEYSSLPLFTAIEAAKASLSLAEERMQSGIEALRQRELTGEKLSSLKSDLRQIALSIIERSADRQHCPVCGTSHTEADLLEKIEALTENRDQDAFDGLRHSIQVAKDAADRARDVTTTISAIAACASGLGMADKERVEIVLSAIRTKNDALSSIKTEIERLQAEVSVSEEGDGGLENTRLRAFASSLLGDALVDSEEEVGRLLLAEKQRIHEIESRRAFLNDSRDKLQIHANDLASRPTQVNVGQTLPPVLAESVERQLASARTALAVVSAAPSVIGIGEDQVFETIRLSIDSVISLLDEAVHAQNSDFEAQSDLEKKLQELHSTNSQLADAQTRSSNLARARDVLARIVEEHSLEKATRSALEGIRENVSAIFGRIHSPNEYVLNDLDSDSLLATIDGKEARGPNQVSTGQRAALALSIFLAMNKSAERAPPIMLIDDPVAHVDDLNALSFLDYLRDVAVSEAKQVFFATADSRLAALFEKKFAFLGDRFSKTILVGAQT